MELVYANRWNRKERRTEGAMEPEEARRRFAEGEPFCILVNRAGRPHAFIEVAAPELTVGLLDDQGRSSLEWGLERTGTRLFIHRATDHQRDTSPPSQSSYFFDEGDRVTIQSSVAPFDEASSEDHSHPVGGHWSTLPPFEALATLLELEPDLPDASSA